MLIHYLFLNKLLNNKCAFIYFSHNVNILTFSAYKKCQYTFSFLCIVYVTFKWYERYALGRA